MCFLKSNILRRCFLFTLSLCLIFPSTTINNKNATVNAGAKEKIGEFLKKREKSKFWGWFYKKYLENPDAFEEWVIMVPTLFGIAALCGIGYGVKKFLHEENPQPAFDKASFDDVRNKFLKGSNQSKSADSLTWPSENKNLIGFYDDLAKTDNNALLNYKNKLLEQIKTKYEQDMHGTGFGSSIWPRTSNSLQAFEDEICKMKVIIELYYKDTDQSENLLASIL